ncbi:IS1595 family transposase [Rhizobium leguminosarum]|uniref:IS1595 family transposase n=1 Tax=Rhizobium leguminosarum TaxID=384 RepID=UPI003F96D16E
MSRNRFKCTEKTCKTVFSVTSGTVFHARKLSFKKMLIAIWFSANSVKGKAALQLSREIGVQYKTAWVLLMKLREAIAWRREEMVLDGEVEIDGKYAGGHIRPENKAEDRIDRRHKKYQNMKRLCALAIRQRGLGGKTFTRVIRDEDGDAAWAAVRNHVSREATVFADEHGSYNDLAGLNKLQRVNHSKAYQTAGRELLLAGPAGVRRHPSSVFVEVLRLVRGRTRVARGLPPGEQSRPYLPVAWEGTVPPDIPLFVRILAGQQTARPDLGRLSCNLPQNLTAVELAGLPNGSRSRQLGQDRRQAVCDV